MHACLYSYYLLTMFQNSNIIDCLSVINTIIIIIIACPSFIYTDATSHMLDRDSSPAIQWWVEQQISMVTCSVLYNRKRNPLYMQLLASHKYDSPPPDPVPLY